MTRRITTAAVIGVLLLAMQSGRAVAAPVRVPCDVAALQTAITDANTAGSGALQLAGSCRYSVVTPSTASEALPVITGTIKIFGGGGTVIERNSAAATNFRIFRVNPGASLRLERITIRNGVTTGLGGGVHVGGTLQAVKTVFKNNRAGNGGGIAVDNGAVASVVKSKFLSNDTTGVGGGAALSSGALTVSDSVIERNTAPLNGGGINVQSAGVVKILGTQVLKNTSAGLGGGLSNLGALHIRHSSVKFNTGSDGGGIATGNSTVFIRKSVIRENEPNNCSPTNTIPHCKN